MCRLRNIAMRDYQESSTTGQTDTHTHTDGRTDRQTLDKVIPMCRYASQATQKLKSYLNYAKVFMTCRNVSNQTCPKWTNTICSTKLKFSSLTLTFNPKIKRGCPRANTCAKYDHCRSKDNNKSYCAAMVESLKSKFDLDLWSQNQKRLSSGNCEHICEASFLYAKRKWSHHANIV